MKTVNALVVVITFLLCSCVEKKPEKVMVNEPAAVEDLSSNPFRGTQEMAKMLNDIDMNCKPEHNSYQSVRRAEYYENLLKNAGQDMEFKLKSISARELLGAARSEEAAAKFMELIDIVRADMKNASKPGKRTNPEVLESYREVYANMRRFLAVCYVQLGEQENCQHNHTSKSCLLPIESEGIQVENDLVKWLLKARLKSG